MTAVNATEARRTLWLRRKARRDAKANPVTDAPTTVRMVWDSMRPRMAAMLLRILTHAANCSRSSATREAA